MWTQARRRGFALADVVTWMAQRPAELAGLRAKGRIAPGGDADLVVFAPDAQFVVDPGALHHRNPVTPYAGRTLDGVVRGTWLRGGRIDGEVPRGRLLMFRVHGEVIPDPRLLTATVDLAALAAGGRIVECSNMFWASPVNLIMPGEARITAEGWETARRRDDGNDFVTFALAAPGIVGLAELDARHFIGNAPGWASLSGIDARTGALDDPDAWFELLPRTRLQPDTPHRFRLTTDRVVTHVRMDVFPDGGLARVRLLGTVPAAERDQLGLRWFNALPEAHARAVVVPLVGAEPAAKLVAARPIADPEELPDALRASLGQ